MSFCTGSKFISKAVRKDRLNARQEKSASTEKEPFFPKEDPEGSSDNKEGVCAGLR
jgi:hypothetical protein